MSCHFKFCLTPRSPFLAAALDDEIQKELDKLEECDEGPTDPQTERSSQVRDEDDVLQKCKLFIKTYFVLA